jgi:hypothetical protein
METTARRTWTPKAISQRVMVAIAGLAIAASAYAVPAPAHATGTTHALIVCQSASFKGNPSWSSPTLRTLYYGNKIGVRQNYSGGHYYENGFYLVADYGYTGNDYWGYVYHTCVGGWNSW